MIQVDDLSRSLIAFEQISTLVIVVELSQSSWLAAGVIPGIERRPLKKLDPDPTALLHLVEGWRDRATKAGRAITRTVLAFESGRDGFWLARWLRVRGVETFVMHSTSVAVSREPRRAKPRQAAAPKAALKPTPKIADARNRGEWKAAVRAFWKDPANWSASKKGHPLIVIDECGVSVTIEHGEHGWSWTMWSHGKAAAVATSKWIYIRQDGAFPAAFPAFSLWSPMEGSRTASKADRLVDCPNAAQSGQRGSERAPAMAALCPEAYVLWAASQFGFDPKKRALLGSKALALLSQ